MSLPAPIRGAATALLVLVAVLASPSLLAQDGTPDPTFAGGVPKRWGYPGSSDPFATVGGVAIDAQARTIVVGSRGVSDSPGVTSRHLEIARLGTDGEFDNTFGTMGRRTHFNWRGTLHVVTDVKLDHQGRIVIAGTLGGQVMVARLLEDGSFDTSFGDLGVALSLVGGPVRDTNRVERIAIAADDSVIAVGFRTVADQQSGSGFLVPFAWKLTALGQTDDHFASNGVWNPPEVLDNSGFLYDVVADDDGFWLAVGGLGRPGSGGFPRDAIALRLSSTGVPDATFGNGGIARFEFGGSDPSFDGVVRLPGGSYRASGNVGTAQEVRIFIAAIGPSGALETSYGTGGSVSVLASLESGEAGQRKDLMLKPDGSLLAAGPVRTIGSVGVGDVAGSVLRVSASGTQSATYGTSGVARISFGNSTVDRAHRWAHVVSRGGRTIAVGGLDLGSSSDFAVVALRDQFLFSDGFE